MAPSANLSTEAGSETLSIVIPVLNEAEGIVGLLERLQQEREAGTQVIVVDGGSTDETQALAAPLADEVITSPRGRANQMNCGARAATGDLLLFLHADATLPAEFRRLVANGLSSSGADWGRFDVRLTGGALVLRVVEFFINRRSRLTGIATGDQAIFVRREIFESLGGYEPIPLMEDVALTSALRKLGRPLCIREPVLVSSRKWEREGVVRTILLMWWLRLAYFFGASPERLVRLYYR